MGQTVTVTRRVRFNASRTLSVPAWDEARNRATFGAEAGPYPVGRDFELEVTLRGEPDPETGMVINLNTMKMVLQEIVVARMDCQYLNAAIPLFSAILPSNENLALYLVGLLDCRFPGVKLCRLKLQDTPDSWVEWRADR